MEKFKLKLEPREAKTPNQLRREGKVPATVYGPGAPSESVQIEEKELISLPPAAFSHIIELQGNAGKPVNAIIRHVQRRPTNHKVLNVEFYRVASDRKLTVVVPLKFKGVSPAVQAGGQVIESHQEAQVECLPQDIPDFIEVDMAKIEQLDQGIHFSDLQPPASVRILNPPEEIVVRVITPRAAQVEEAKPAAEAAAAAAAPAASTPS